MAARFWLMRHAETAEPSTFHGAESDIGLSEHGRRTAALIAPHLAALRPAAVISSAMRRAVDTATPIAAACGVALRLEPQLHERRIGVLSGVPTSPEHPHWTATVRRWREGETSYASPGAESFDEVRDRAFPVLERLATEFRGRSAVIVAHGATIKVLLLSLLSGWSAGDWRQFGPIHNLAVTELISDNGQWHAVQMPAVPPIVAAERMLDDSHPQRVMSPSIPS